MIKKIRVNVLSAFTLGGAIQVAGTAKEPNSVLVDEKLAKNLLRRGKVVLSEGAAFAEDGDDEDEDKDAGKSRRAKKPAAAAKPAQGAAD